MRKKNNLEDFLESVLKLLETERAVLVDVQVLKELAHVVLTVAASQTTIQLEQQLLGLVHVQSTVVVLVDLREDLAYDRQRIRVVDQAVRGRHGCRASQR